MMGGEQISNNGNFYSALVSPKQLCGLVHIKALAFLESF